MRKQSVHKRAPGLLPVIALAALVATSACEFGGPFPEDVAASKAINDAVWETRTRITFNGAPYEFAVSDTRDFAQIAPAAPNFAYTAADLEQATAAQTGCSAVFQGGFLDRLDGYTPDTNLRSTQDGLVSFRRWRIDLSC